MAAGANHKLLPEADGRGTKKGPKGRSIRFPGYSQEAPLPASCRSIRTSALRSHSTRVGELGGGAKANEKARLVVELGRKRKGVGQEGSRREWRRERKGKEGKGELVFPPALAHAPRWLERSAAGVVLASGCEGGCFLVERFAVKAQLAFPCILLEPSSSWTISSVSTSPQYEMLSGNCVIETRNETGEYWWLAQSVDHSIQIHHVIESTGLRSHIAAPSVARPSVTVLRINTSTQRRNPIAVLSVGSPFDSYCISLDTRMSTFMRQLLL
ncbi:uncharacterized protein ACOB8E_013539 [Sarcophilus harrisii]